MSLEPSWTGRAALLAAVGDHPFARYYGFDDIRGYAARGAVIGAAGTMAWGFGDPLAAAGIGARLDGLTHLDLPRTSRDAIAGRLPVARHRDWRFRWTETPPSPYPHEDRVVVLGAEHHDAITGILDDVLPYTGNRPGDPRNRGWYGILDGQRLAAVGGDRSRHGVGYLAPIAVAARYQGRGYGAAITAFMTRARVAEFGLCALGVVEDNAHALGFFDRMGYAHRELRSLIDYR